VIGQYDVCQNKDPSSRKRIPYFIVLQCNFLSSLATVIVAPVMIETEANIITKLNPAFEISGKKYRTSMADLAGIPRTRLGEVVTNLGDQHTDFISAIDLLFSGF
jgi:toxin CcdB